MRILRVVSLSLLIALSPLALAKLSLPNHAFGKSEGALDFCAQADPPSAPKYHEKNKTLTQGASEQEVAEARASMECKKGYDSSTEGLSKLPKEQVAKTCTGGLERTSVDGGHIAR